MTRQHFDVTPEMFSRMVLRFLILQTHYRKPMNYTEADHRAAAKALRRLYLAAEMHVGGAGADIAEVIECLADDLNTPKAIAVMHRYRANGEGAKRFKALEFLGLFGNETLPDDWRLIPGREQDIGPETMGAA